MHLIELHIIQSFPVTCLNRDDLNAPKTAVFGGQLRARVSSQSWKRAIREMAIQSNPGYFGGRRGHFFAKEIRKAIEAEGIPAERCQEAANKIADFLGETDAKNKEGHRTAVALFFTPKEIEGIAKAASQDIREKGEVNPKSGAFKKAIQGVSPSDMADVAIFGRMVAKDHSLMVEGAGLFSHALSTHRVSNDIDFFSAVDDLKPETSEGAGHIGTLEFNSACYYRYVGLNLGLLADNNHLGHLSDDERNIVIDNFIRASILAVPNARKNSMFGHNPPIFVLGLRRKGQPLSLVNAFEGGIRHQNNGYVQPSIDALKAHYESLKKTYGLEAKEVCIPDVDLNTFCKEIQ